MPFEIDYSEEKNELLKKIRGVCFEDIIEALQGGGYLDLIEHRGAKKYKNQQILIIQIKKYAYAVPFVYNKKRTGVFLKTVYPDRKLTRRYIKKIYD